MIFDFLVNSVCFTTCCNDVKKNFMFSVIYRNNHTAPATLFTAVYAKKIVDRLKHFRYIKPLFVILILPTGFNAFVILILMKVIIFC